MITIKDIAKVAGVSHTTVSRALNDNPLIKQETRDKIKKIALELNYVPNYSAKSLVMKKSYTIGLFFSSIDQGTSASFLADVIKGIHQVIDENYHFSVNGIDDIKHIETITAQRFDGIIVMSQSDADNGFIYHVNQAKIPLVVLNRQLEDNSLLNVVANDRQGVRQAIDFAIAQGHQQIGIIEGKAGFKSSSERKEGFIDSLVAHRIPINPDYLVRGDYSSESGAQLMTALLSLKTPPTLVFCSNDDMAIGAINACYQLGKRIPEEMSLIGFDDIMFAKYTTPALTTVRRPIDLISKTGTEKLIQLMQKRDSPVEQIFVDTSLIIRDSVAQLN